MYSRFKTRENVLSYVLRAKSGVTNGAVKSSEIQILRLKDNMFSINALNF